eukprot:scaffold161752_cov32-Tisochrysis_lutea.AAC.3
MSPSQHKQRSDLVREPSNPSPNPARACRTCFSSGGTCLAIASRHKSMPFDMGSSHRRATISDACLPTAPPQASHTQPMHHSAASRASPSPSASLPLLEESPPPMPPTYPPVEARVRSELPIAPTTAVCGEAEVVSGPRTASRRVHRPEGSSAVRRRLRSVPLDLAVFPPGNPCAPPGPPWREPKPGGMGSAGGRNGAGMAGCSTGDRARA